VFARIEVAMKPEFNDPAAQSILRKIEMSHPEIRKKIRWARMLDVYWLDLPTSREEVIPALTEVFWDRVLQWLFTGNLIPSAAGKTGGIQDILTSAPFRPGKFWGLERRFRPGVTDNVGRTVLEAFEIVLGRKLPEARAASGSLLVLEGNTLNEDDLSMIARDVFCNELIESWTLVPEMELIKSEQFHQERVKRELPRVTMRGSDQVETYTLDGLSDSGLEQMSKKQLWALNLEEMKAVRDYFAKESRTPTDVEMEVIAQTWSEHCKHKIFGAKFNYAEDVGSNDPVKARIPAETNSLFKTTIAGTTAQLTKPWLLSVFSDNAGIVAFDEEDAFCIKVETHNSPSALDPYGGALTGIVGVNRDILGCGLGAKPVFNTDVFCVAPLDYNDSLPDRLLHPRRILDGVRRGVEHGGNKSGIPTVNGALVFDERYLGKPLVYCGTGGFMPRTIAGRPCQLKEILPGDKICMVGGRIGKDGIHGATFSSLALDDASPVSAVQLGDPITQKRTADFLLEARDLGLYRAVTDNGAGGLSSSVGELAQLSNGARMEVGRAKTKYPGLKPFELVVSESQERMTVAVPGDQLRVFTELAERRGVEVSEIGEFTESGRFEISYHEKVVASLELEFLHGGTPKLEINAHWNGLPELPKTEARDYEKEAPQTLVELLAQPNIASKEWLIRQYDHEVQGTSVIKPLHTAHPGTQQASSGPNDGGVIKPKPTSDKGIAVASGINAKMSDLDPYLMAQSAVDEAVRNALCVGAEYGSEENVFALVDNFCWPDPVSDTGKAAALVRACYGMQKAALELGTPLVSGKDSMKNDFRGKKDGNPITISVPPTLLMTAVARVNEVRFARTSDFKSAGDIIYLLGGESFGLAGSELWDLRRKQKRTLPRTPTPSLSVGLSEYAEIGLPNWERARQIYSWLGRKNGTTQVKFRSIHDISEGGLLVAVAEGLFARGLGAKLQVPASVDPWVWSFGEGFHSFVATATETDAPMIEAECKELGIPLQRIGSVAQQDRLEVQTANGVWNIGSKQLKLTWQKGGYWE
jgi:phosphoribosylformylglycinamidine synthase subunit PurSL